MDGGGQTKVITRLIASSKARRDGHLCRRNRVWVEAVCATKGRCLKARQSMPSKVLSACGITAALFLCAGGPTWAQSAPAAASPERALASDRLIQEIAAAGLAQVVDRTQLDRMLQDRDLRADPGAMRAELAAFSRVVAVRQKTDRNVPRP
jgi:hypothetical protein